MANKYFVDTDVLLDLIAEREPFAESAAFLFDLCDQGQLLLCTSTLCLNNLHYIIRKKIGEKGARNAVADLLDMLEVLPVNKNHLTASTTSAFSDFEDAVQHEVAKSDEAIKVIITRNVKHYAKGELAALTPPEFLDFYHANG
jgi:predicted nucleic acid-binding protein